MKKQGAELWLREKKLVVSAHGCYFKKLDPNGDTEVAELPDGSELGTVISPLSSITGTLNFKVMSSGKVTYLKTSG